MINGFSYPLAFVVSIQLKRTRKILFFWRSRRHLHFFIFLQKKSVLGLQALSDCSGWSLSHYKYCLLQEKFPELLKFEINLLRGQLFALEHYYYSRALTDSSQRLEQFYEKRDALLEVFQPQTLIKSKPLRILAQYIGISPQMLSLLRNRQRGKR